MLPLGRFHFKRKGFVPHRRKFFAFRVDPFPKGCAGRQTGTAGWGHCITLQYLSILLRRMYTCSGETTIKIVLSLFPKGVYSKRKEFAPKGTKFFHFWADSFSEGTSMCRKANKKSWKLSPLIKMKNKILSISKSFEVACSDIFSIQIHTQQGCIQKCKVIANIFSWIPVPNNGHQQEQGSREKHWKQPRFTIDSMTDNKNNNGLWDCFIPLHYRAVLGFWLQEQYSRWVKLEKCGVKAWKMDTFPVCWHGRTKISL